MITKEKIVEILQNKWNRSNLLYSEIADEILKLDKVKLDYEILEFTSKNSGCKAIKNDRGTYDSDNFFNMDESRLLSDNRSIITKVKRLSDGKVFTIGDRIMCGNFAEIKPLLKIELSNYNDGIYLTTENYYNCPLNYVIKVRQPILVTEDGKELFKNNKFWHVDSYWNIGVGYLQKDTFEKLKGYKEFSTKEAAEEYILLNKPCLSYNDLINSIEDNGLLKSVMTMRILKLVKSKLK